MSSTSVTSTLLGLSRLNYEDQRLGPLQQQQQQQSQQHKELLPRHEQPPLQESQQEKLQSGQHIEHQPQPEPEPKEKVNGSSEPIASDSSDTDEPAVDPAERAMKRAQVRAQAFVNRSSSSDMLAEPKKSWPPLARKKSGELVKSSLRSRPGLTRTKSEPTRKAVHFNQKLEDVRPFRKSQRPSAVNPEEKKKPRFRTGDSEDAASDLTDNDDDDDDSDDENGWTLLTPGFVPHRYGGMNRQRPIVYLDSLQLNSDKSAVNGTIFVRNLSFSKHVAVRYTMDGWSSFSETKATWNDDVRKHERDAGYDRFDMSLKLRCFSPTVLCDTVMFLCVRYNVNGEEYWDNNNGSNYELYLRNSELLHAVQKKKKSPPSQSVASTRSNSGVRRSESAGAIENMDSVKEILKNAMLEGDDKTTMAGPPGIPMKRHSGSNKNRYSFEQSYAMPPRQQQGARTAQPRYTAFAAQQLARSWMPQDAAVPMPANLKDSERASAPRVVSDQPHYHTWESQSYKDFVSKYCFYTPVSSPEKARDKAAREGGSREGSPESVLSSVDSSEVDLPSMRSDITLSLERETNRV